MLRQKAAAKVARPVDSSVSAALETVYQRFGGHWIHADPEIIGIISPADVALYGLDLEAYEQVPFAEKESSSPSSRQFNAPIQSSSTMLLNFFCHSRFAKSTIKW